MHAKVVAWWLLGLLLLTLPAHWLILEKRFGPWNRGWSRVIYLILQSGQIIFLLCIVGLGFAISAIGYKPDNRMAIKLTGGHR